VTSARATACISNSTIGGAGFIGTAGDETWGGRPPRKCPPQREPRWQERRARFSSCAFANLSLFA
jgi:hypothetical protein